MANEISLSELQRLANKYNVRLWQCRKVGRRWSFLSGAGEERPLPSQLLYESNDIGFFIQGEDAKIHELTAELKKLT